MSQHPHHRADADPGTVQPPKALGWRERIRLAFGKAAPGGASCPPSPTLGRSGGSPAPGVAGPAQRQGTQSSEARAPGGPTQDTLHTVQADILAAARSTDAHSHSAAAPRPAEVTSEEFVHHNTAALDRPALPADSMQAVPLAAARIRRYTGHKRDTRITGRYSERDRAELEEAAESHGYQGSLSGFIADIAIAFSAGLFTVTLPLSDQTRAQAEFRAQVLRELGRIGNNVNQIARHLNVGDTPPDIRHGLGELHRLLAEIAEALCHHPDTTEA